MGTTDIAGTQGKRKFAFEHSLCFKTTKCNVMGLEKNVSERFKRVQCLTIEPAKEIAKTLNNFQQKDAATFLGDVEQTILDIIGRIYISGTQGKTILLST